MMFKIDIDSAVQYSLKYQNVVQAIMYCTTQYIDVIVILLYCLNSQKMSPLQLILL